MSTLMSINNLTEYRENYSYYRDEANDNIANSKSFRSKPKSRRNSPDSDNKKILKQQFH